MNSGTEKTAKTFAPPVNQAVAKLRLPPKLDKNIAAKVDKLISKGIQAHAPTVNETINKFIAKVQPLLDKGSLSAGNVDQIVALADMLHEDAKSCGFRASSSIMKSICLSLRDDELEESEKLALLEFVANRLHDILNVDLEGDMERISAFVREVREHWSFD